MKFANKFTLARDRQSTFVQVTKAIAGNLNITKRTYP